MLFFISHHYFPSQQEWFRVASMLQIIHVTGGTYIHHNCHLHMFVCVCSPLLRAIVQTFILSITQSTQMVQKLNPSPLSQLSAQSFLMLLYKCVRRKYNTKQLEVFVKRQENVRVHRKTALIKLKQKQNESIYSLQTNYKGKNCVRVYERGRKTFIQLSIQNGSI